MRLTKSQVVAIRMEYNASISVEEKQEIEKIRQSKATIAKAKALVKKIKNAIDDELISFLTGRYFFQRFEQFNDDRLLEQAINFVTESEAEAVRTKYRSRYATDAIVEVASIEAKTVEELHARIKGKIGLYAYV